MRSATEQAFAARRARRIAFHGEIAFGGIARLLDHRPEIIEGLLILPPGKLIQRGLAAPLYLPLSWRPGWHRGIRRMGSLPKMRSREICCEASDAWAHCSSTGWMRAAASIRWAAATMVCSISSRCASSIRLRQQGEEAGKILSVTKNAQGFEGIPPAPLLLSRGQIRRARAALLSRGALPARGPPAPAWPHHPPLTTFIKRALIPLPGKRARLSRA